MARALDGDREDEGLDVDLAAKVTDGARERGE
jgi:hypothetical protein